MGERSRERNSNSPQLVAQSRSYPPRSQSLMTEAQRSYDTESRLHQAELIAISRSCNITPTMRSIISSQESFFHGNQQSAGMVIEYQTRALHSYETMREATIKKQIKEERPLKVPSLDVNPTKITLSLELEYQYFEQMMNQDYDNVENLSTIMQKTNTLIQLPDRDECNQANPFAQQVAVTGIYKDVEDARFLIRENCPIFAFVSFDSEDSAQHFQSILTTSTITYDRVKVEYWDAKQEDKFDVPTLRLTSHQKHSQYLVATCDRLVDTVFHGSAPEKGFTIFMDLSSFHVDHIIGIHGSSKKDELLLMPIIEKKTNTQITYPSYKSSIELKSSILSVRINGKDMSSVLEARKYILDLLPIAICFNINNSDMREPASDEHRIVEFAADETTMVTVKFVRSKSEPKHLLDGEESQHSASIRSREFMIKEVYDAYYQLISPKLELVRLKPISTGISLWQSKQIPSQLRKFEIPCRGEPLGSRRHDRRGRERAISGSSAFSEERKAFQRSSSVSSVDETMRNSKRHSSVSSMTACDMMPAGSSTAMPLHPYQVQHLQQQVPYVLISSGMPFIDSTRTNMVAHQVPHHQQHPSNYMLLPLMYLQSTMDMPNGSDVMFVPSDNQQVYPAVNQFGGQRKNQTEANNENNESANTAPSYNRRANLSIASRNRNYNEQENDRKRDGTYRGVNIGSGVVPHRHDNHHEQSKIEEDARSTKSMSRRTSVTEDESFGSYESRGMDRSSVLRPEYQIHLRGVQSKFPISKWRHTAPQTIVPRNNELSSYPKRSNNGFPKGNYRGHHRSEHEYIDGSQNNTVSCEQQQFSVKHCLQLRAVAANPNAEDSFFIQDNSQVEDRSSPKPQYQQPSSHNSSFDVGYSPHDRDETQPRKIAENEKFYHKESVHLEPRSQDLYRKTPSPVVSKTMLVPKLRNDKNCPKTHLETKTREKCSDSSYTPQGLKLAPLDLIARADVEKQTGISANVEPAPDRTFADVLRDKNNKQRQMTSATQMTSIDSKNAFDGFVSEGDQTLLLEQKEMSKPKRQPLSSEVIM